MLQAKQSQNQIQQQLLINNPSSDSSGSYHIRHCSSKIIDLPEPQFISLEVEKGQVFKCYQCSSNDQNNLCSECKGKGYIESDHPLVKLMNQLFNNKFTASQKCQDNKQMLSTKSSSNYSISDSILRYENTNSSDKKNLAGSLQKKPKEGQRSSILQFIRTPLQTIIKEESTYLDQKCRKCNICHYEFDNIKYTCEQCQNYNVCEQCYKTKRISHCHDLRKIQSLSSKKTSKLEDDQKQHLNQFKFENPFDYFKDQNKQFLNYLQQREKYEQKQGQFSHSDVDKVQLKSDDQQGHQLLFNVLDTQGNKQQKQQNENLNLKEINKSIKTETTKQKQEQNQNQNPQILNQKQKQKQKQIVNNLNTASFLKQNQNQHIKLQAKLHYGQIAQCEVQQSKKLKHKQTFKSCQNCHNKIDDCFWICETCEQEGQNYQICKDCYDNGLYSHPAYHNLGLNFFSLSSSFFQPEGKSFFDQIVKKCDQFEQEEFILKDSQLRNGQPLSSVTPSTLTSSTQCQQHKSQPDILNIGVIKHRDIFTGFHKQCSQNEHYLNEIISPIPKNIQSHPFKTIATPSQSDSLMIPELMTQSEVNQLSRYNNDQKYNKQNQILKQKQKRTNSFILKQPLEQSRVLFDDTALMDFSTSTDYGQLASNRKNYLNKSQRKATNNSNNNKNQTYLVSSMNRISQINPQHPNLSMTGILLRKSQECDYCFYNFCCDICGISPIKNIKYHCLQCEDYDLCNQCYTNKREEHWHSHFRKDDGLLMRSQQNQNIKKLACNKLNNSRDKILLRATQQLNASIHSPLKSMRKSVRFIK